MENNNDSNYSERVNENKQFINNYGKTSYNKITNIKNSNNRNSSNNKNNKKDDLLFYLCCLLGICQISFMFQSIELFLISLVVLIICRRKFLYVVIGTISMATIIGIIAFGLCVFSIFSM